MGKLISELLEYNKINNFNKSDTDIQQLERISQELQGQKNNNNTGKIKSCCQDIKTEIIKHIYEAKFAIWVCVAWFTDADLFQRLIDKKNQGVNVRLIINDDENNKKSGLDYQKFETHKIKKIGKYGTNSMHDKFCILDLKTVIHGSYNWTKNAKYNDDTITVIEDNCEQAKLFSEQFIALINRQS
ncbi:phospholipase D-like domain-containing protein [Microcystis aeruginosa]|uniref:phospholipase D n=1 Tax=Microcystis aeruginosa NIES-2521 TaxID=2303983 RepID=A0A5A5S1S4_MICAE|nr:phospholipase D-like domain-containing protein [Microcystis aeruginosa]GCA79411.1 cardiolipin synthase [Microcystis aeruginosa NIES-2521]